MTTPDFNSDRLSKNLSERVKELECLYKIARIARLNKDDLDTQLSEIVKEIPNGWQHPDKMMAYLKFGTKEYGEIPTSKRFQSTIIHINADVKGELIVAYRAEPNNLNTSIFLLEEQALLNQIGFDLSSLIELDLKKQKEILIEQKLRVNDRLNLLGEITAGIAHELNTPLGNILGYTELLIKGEKDTDKSRDLQKVLKSTIHAREIVKKLMFFSCEMPSQYKKINVNDLIRENIELLKIQLLEKSIVTHLNLAEGAPDIKLDPVQFSQVIFNIVLNAIDAMKPKGSLTITTVQVQKDFRLKITDNGIGISDEDKNKLFQPFYSTKDSPGTGLGLAVTHGIIQSHGGRIEVESQLGRGTTFTIILKTD